MVLFLCTSSDGFVYLYKLHEYILNGFRDVEHKSTSLMVLNTNRVDTIFKLKTA